jgi:hypothetical protein
MSVQIQLRRGTEQEWFTANSLLAQGELGAEIDTGRFKLGDGITYWHNLPYSSGIQGITGTAATISVGSVTTGTTASIVNVGDQQNAVFNFTIPLAPKGDTGTQINKLIDIPDIDRTGLAAGSMLIYNGSDKWNTEKDLPISSNIDAGEF